MILSDLESLGLSEEEARSYLAVLELGGGYVSVIANKAKIHRVNAYYILDKLVKKGLLTVLPKDRLKYYAPEPPQVLVNQQEEHLERAKKLLPELLVLKSALAYRPSIQYHEGTEGIKKVMEDTLTAKSEVLGYTNLTELPKVFGGEYLRRYARKKMEREIKSRMLSPIGTDALKYLKTYYPKGFDCALVEIFFIDPSAFMFEYEINIYDDKVGLVSLNPKEPIGVMIQGAVYARTQQAIFNLAWLGATSFVVG